MSGKAAHRPDAPSKPAPKSGTSQQPQSGKKAVPPPEKKKHLVIIKNCENDFSRIHCEALIPYCGLAKDRCGKPKSAPATDAAEAEALAYYEMTCRTETRSAEIRFYANAATVMGCFSSAQASQLPSGASRKRSREDEATNEEEDKEDEVTDDADHSAAPVGEEKKKGPVAAPRFGSVEDMVTIMKTKPYFTHPPVFHLSTGDAVEATSSDSLVKASDAVVTSSAQLVSCMATTSVPQSAKQLRALLADIPGFVSCWSLHALNFRVVFSSKALLFAAKALLDQFEADSGNRVTLKFPDSLGREYTEHLHRNE
jgi:hypothetical protein